MLAMANLTKFTGGTLAAIMLDAMQGHSHALYHSGFILTGGGSGMNMGNLPGTNKDTDNNHIRGPVSDNVNGDPRTAGETRPASVSLNFGIYFE